MSICREFEKRPIKERISMAIKRRREKERRNGSHYLEAGLLLIKNKTIERVWR
jgi:hypothetical protein